LNKTACRNDKTERENPPVFAQRGSLSAAEIVHSDAGGLKIRYNNMVRINNVLKETVIWMKN
jgi:hypothetical protein